MSGIQGYSDKEMPTCNPAAAVVGMASWGVGYVQHAITRSTYTAEEQADYYDYGEVAFNLLDLGLAVRGIYNLSMSVTKSLILHLDDVAGAPSDIKTIGQGYTIRKNNNSKVWQFSDIDFE